MRISDWSSDVCSSDLRRRAPLSDPPLVGRYHDDQRRAAHIARDQRNLAAARNAPGGKARGDDQRKDDARGRSEEHTSELQSLMRTSYAVFCLKKKKN